MEAKENEYMPCEGCSKKAGLYQLCESCYHNRTLIDRLVGREKDLYEALSKFAPDLMGELCSRLNTGTGTLQHYRDYFKKEHGK